MKYQSFSISITANNKNVQLQCRIKAVKRLTERKMATGLAVTSDIQLSADEKRRDVLGPTGIYDV